MSDFDDQKALDYERDELEGAEAALYFRVVSYCPGKHQTKQYRDGRRAWCSSCGRTDRGQKIKEVK